MTKKILKVSGIVLGVLALAIGAFALLTVYRFERHYDPPLPKIARAAGPEALARGEVVFANNCAPCHVGDDGSARGHKLEHFPSLFGEVWTANITGDPEHGIGGWTDGQIARLVRTQIGPDGRFRAMPAAGLYLADDDLSALLAFLRSGHDALRPKSESATRSKLSFTGKAIFVWMLGMPIDTPTSVPMPKREASVEYGRYLSMLGECWQCHTEGFDRSKIDGPQFMAGGFCLEQSQGTGLTVCSTNITFDETGLGNARWTLAGFSRALREGINPQGQVLRPPMPHFRLHEDFEVEALWKYLQSLPKVRRVNTPGTAPIATVESNEADPEKLWSQLGCVSCHGETGLYRDQLKHAVGKPVDEVARWIRNPQSFKPATQMPTFESLLDEPRALKLAAWVQQRAASQR